MPCVHFLELATLYILFTNSNYIITHILWVIHSPNTANISQFFQSFNKHVECSIQCRTRTRQCWGTHFQLKYRLWRSKDVSIFFIPFRWELELWIHWLIPLYLVTTSIPKTSDFVTNMKLVYSGVLLLTLKSSHCLWIGFDLWTLNFDTNVVFFYPLLAEQGRASVWVR